MSEEDINMLRSDYKQLVSMIIGLTHDQAAHADTAKSNAESIGELKGLMGKFSDRLEGHMDDEEAKIEANAQAMRDLADAVDRLQSVLGEAHNSDHDWVRDEIRRRRKQDLAREATIALIKKQVIAWSVPAALAGTFYIFREGIMATIMKAAGG